MTIRSEIAAILKTTEERLDARLVGLRIAPVCSRCGGSGRYSFNQIDGDRCYGCNGQGHVKPRSQDLPDLLKEARACVEDGRFDAYLATLAARKAIKTGQKRVMDAWSSTIVARTNNDISHFTRSEEMDGLADLRAANKAMHDAHKMASEALRQAAYPSRGTSPAERDNLALIAAKAVEEAIAQIKAADYQPPEHLVNAAKEQAEARATRLKNRW